MARLDPGASARWMARRAKQAAASLKAEYEAGKRGDDSPVEPIYPTPREQLQALQRLLAGGPEASTAPHSDAAGASDPSSVGVAVSDGVVVEPAVEVGPSDTVTTEHHDHADDEAGAMAAALRRVDWQQVRAVTAERTGDAAAAMRSMAGRVDWAKVQPVAAQVSSALIAAVAAGRVPVGGSLGPLVAKALTDSGTLAGRVGARLQAGDELPPDFRDELPQDVRDELGRDELGGAE